MEHQNKLIYGGLLAISALTGCTEPVTEKPLNIVYIMTDDHTAQMMSCYDKRYMDTPNLDRIANEGVRFTNSFVANSLSGPSRACMLTGKHSCENKFYDNSTCVFDSSQQTFPKLLQKAGYQTALIGKWHLESLPTGFTYWEIVPGQGDYYNPDFITQTNDTIQRHGYITNLITDDAIDWMENKRDKEKPFCLLIHHKAIHRNLHGFRLYEGAARSYGSKYGASVRFYRGARNIQRQGIFDRHTYRFLDRGIQIGRAHV